jgi:hypothetical protein
LHQIRSTLDKTGKTPNEIWYRAGVFYQLKLAVPKFFGLLKMLVGIARHFQNPVLRLGAELQAPNVIQEYFIHHHIRQAFFDVVGMLSSRGKRQDGQVCFDYWQGVGNSFPTPD